MALIQTNLNKQPIILGDSASNDSFGRLRVSEPYSLIDTVFQYGTNPLFWQSYFPSGGSITHLPNESAIQLSATTVNGCVLIRQSFDYFRYQPGRSQTLLMTGVMGAKKTNVTQRLGLFDDSNGLFFEQDGTNLKIVVRTYTSGSVVNNSINQSSWNIDKLDGTGQSQLQLDMSKAQIFIIDFEWLGVGRIRFGFNINGITYYCHQVLNANSINTVYMTTANLPLRYELRNTGTVASTTIMKQLCSVVMSEGGTKEYGIMHTASNGATAIAVTTRRAILSIRPKTTFNSIVNRGIISPEQFNIFSDSDIYYEIVHNGTLGGSPSFTSVSTNSIVEYDVAGTTVTGGEVIDAGYLPASAGGIQYSFLNNIFIRLPLSLDINGANPKNLSVVITSLSGTANVRATLKFRELY